MEGHRAAGEQVAGPIHKLEGGQGRDGEKVCGLHRTTLGNLTLHSRLAQRPRYTQSCLCKALGASRQHLGSHQSPGPAACPAEPPPHPQPMTFEYVYLLPTSSK